MTIQDANGAVAQPTTTTVRSEELPDFGSADQAFRANDAVERAALRNQLRNQRERLYRFEQRTLFVAAVFFMVLAAAGGAALAARDPQQRQAVNTFIEATFYVAASVICGLSLRLAVDSRWLRISESEQGHGRS